MSLGKKEDQVIISSETLPNLKNDFQWKKLDHNDVVTIEHDTLNISIDKE